jgi:hypothetical protein
MDSVDPDSWYNEMFKTELQEMEEASTQATSVISTTEAPETPVRQSMPGSLVE